MKTRRGFTLIESLFAMMLVLTILGLVSTLMREYSNVARYTAARDNTLDGVQFGLTEMGHELGTAQVMLAPPEDSDPGVTSTTLSFRRIDPSKRRFPLNSELTYDEDGEPLMWNTRNTANWMRVTFAKDAAGALTRTTVTTTPAATVVQTMVPKIDSLLVTVVSKEYYQIQLSFREDTGRFRQYTVQTRRWVKP